MTKKERDSVLSGLRIIIDSREKANVHIIKELEEMSVPYIVRKLNFADYSCEIPKSEYFPYGYSYENGIAIERKASLEELSSNLSQQRARFMREMERGKNARFFLVVEGLRGYADIMKHNYKTDLDPSAYMASLLTLVMRYNVNVSFVPKELAARWIYRALYYYVYEWLMTAP